VSADFGEPANILDTRNLSPIELLHVHDLGITARDAALSPFLVGLHVARSMNTRRQPPFWAAHAEGTLEAHNVVALRQTNCVAKQRATLRAFQQLHGFGDVK
jgi:hypothetical protein